MTTTTFVIAVAIYICITGYEKLADKKQRENEIQRAKEEGYEVIFID